MRLLAALLALTAPCWAAQKQAPLPSVPHVQLAIDFSAKPMPLSLPAGIPTYSPYPSRDGYVDNSAVMPAPVLQALNGGQAHQFYKAVVAHGWDIPRGDDRQEALFQEGWERESADQAFAKLAEPEVILGKKAPEAKPAKTTKLDFETFGRMSKQANLSTNAFQHADAKRRILKASGYTHLIGAGGRRIPIDQADDVRVGKVYANALKGLASRD